MLPNLFVPGAGKSATSSLHELLNQHPHIYMSVKKEPHFFDNADNFQADDTAKIPQFESFAQLFSDGKEYPFRGESSTGYMVFPHVVERIHKNIPNPRFIFVLRNPIDRAYSHYWWLRGLGGESRKFRDALEADQHEIPNFKNPIKKTGNFRYYFAFGQYATYLRPFIIYFGRENIFVITTESLKSDSKKIMNHCYEFLGVKPLEKIAAIQTNKTITYKKADLYWQVRSKVSTIDSGSLLFKFLKERLSEKQYMQMHRARKSVLNFISHIWSKQDEYPKLSADERQWLCSLYKNEVRELRALTGMFFSEWSKDFP